MLNISLISKDKIGVLHQIWWELFKTDTTVISALAIYRVEKLVVMFSCIN